MQKVFRENAYPKKLVFDILFSNKPDIPSEENLQENNPSKPLLVLPFVKELHSKVKSFCNELGIEYANKRKITLGNLIAPHRPQCPDLSKKHSVYKVSCDSCDTNYIGETGRKTITRMKEHRYSCNKALKSGFVTMNDKNDTGLPKHCLENARHFFKFEDAAVLFQEPNWHKRKMLESIFIALTPSICNIQRAPRFDPNWLHYLQYFSIHPGNI